MELIKKNIIINRPVKCAGTEIGVDGDIIVPDIKPDILKILQVDGKAVVCDTELSEGRLLVSGRIDVNVLYVPDRDDEKIKCIETSFDFSHRIDKDEFMPDMYADVTADVLKVDFHALNCRKLRVKTVVGITYEVSEKSGFELAEGVDDDYAEKLITPVELTSLVDLRNAEFILKENFELPAGNSPIEEILKKDVRICDFEYRVVSGRVALKGNAVLSCLYLDSECRVKSCDFETGFTEVFDVRDADEDTECDISFSEKDISVRAEADSDGDLRVIAFECEVSVRIVATKKVCTDILVDCFLPGSEVNIMKMPAELRNIVATGFYQGTLREIISPGPDCPSLKGVYNIYTTPMIEKSEVLSGKVSFSGSIDCSLLYIAESEETPVFSMKKKIPFSGMAETPGSEPGMEFSVNVRVVHSGFNLNPANEVEVRCITAVSAKVFDKNTVEIIDEIEVVSEVNECKKGTVLYFVQKNDTIWDISKRYGVYQNDILAVNCMEDAEVVCEGKVLLVPTVQDVKKY